MSITEVVDTARALAQMPVRGRAGFWFWPGSARRPARLCIHGLQDRIGGRLPPAAVRGVVMSDETGALSLGSPTVTADHLPPLAGWVREHVADHPALGRLRDAALLQIVPGGVVVARYTDSALWADIPAAVSLGSADETTARLASLQPGQSAWIALGPAAVALVPVDDDPDGAAQARQVQRVRAGGGEVPLRGVLTRLPTGRLSLRCAAPPVSWRAMICALVATHPGLSALLDVVLTRPAADRMTAAALVPEGLDLSRLSRALQRSGKAAFWLTDADRDGLPALVLAPDPDALKSRAKSRVGSGAVMRGTLRLSSPPVLRTRQAHPALLAVLAGWVRASVAKWPALAALRDTTITTPDGAQHAEPALWAFLSDEEAHHGAQ